MSLVQLGNLRENVKAYAGTDCLVLIQIEVRELTLDPEIRVLRQQSLLNLEQEPVL